MLRSVGEDLSLGEEAEPYIIRAASDCVMLKKRTETDPVPAEELAETFSLPVEKLGRPEDVYAHEIDFQKLMALAASIRTLAEPLEPEARSFISPSVTQFNTTDTGRSARKILNRNQAA